MSKKTARIDIRLSNNEYTLMKQKTKKSGLSVAALFRKFLREEPVRERPSIDVHGLYSELNAIGNNVNQIARIANTNGGIDLYHIYQLRALLARAIDLLDERTG